MALARIFHTSTETPTAGKPLRAVSAARPAGLRAWWQQPWLPGALLVAATLLAYKPAWHGGFIWDDDAWTSNVSGLLRNLSGLCLMWCKPTALQQYFPVTGTSFWLDYQLWGFRTLPYHVENVLLHACAALLFWRLLLRLQVPGAWLASAIFALHPVMVESVAWITERKNVLSLVFYLGALLAYARFSRFWQEDDNLALAAGNRPSRRSAAYALALLLFLAAHLSKATTFSLPPLLLLVGWWKRGHLRWRTDVLPSLPFFAIAVSLGLATVWLERNHIGAKGEQWDIPFPERCLIAGQALWFYTGKLLWPANLCFIYPRWQPNPGSWAQWLYPATAGGVVLSLWLARRRIGRGPLTAVLFFAGTLFPMLGFINAYFMRYSFVCDHWAYLPSLGLITLGAALVVRALEHLHTPRALYVFAAFILPLLAGLTWQQSKIYRDIETLWRDTLAKHPACWMAHNNLGTELLRQRRTDEALAEFKTALRLKPNYEVACYNLGLALLRKGRLDEAQAQFQQAVDLKPDYAGAHNNLANIFLRQGKPREALAHYQLAARFRPKNADIANNLAWLLATCPDASLRNGPQAIELAQKAERLSSGQEPVYIATLAAAYAEAGQFSDAVFTAHRALQLASVQRNTALAQALSRQIALYQAGTPFRDTTTTDALQPQTQLR